jgi:mRNA-degrading endonuclease RelE of RelBE toxin-antitoxin system
MRAVGDGQLPVCHFQKPTFPIDSQPSTPNLQLSVNTFQIIFTPTSAAELARMPKELQLQILGDFRGLPQQVRGTELDEFGKLERGGRILHRFRVGDYRVYFERHELGVLVHRILSRHTFKDFYFRSGLKTGEDEALQENPKFWELIEAAKTSAK